MERDGRIESDVPIPPVHKKELFNLLASLKPGESVVLEKPSKYCSVLAYNVGGRSAFTVRKIDATHTRVWRVK